MSFILQFPEDNIKYWAERYQYKNKNADIELDAFRNEVCGQGYLTTEQLYLICRWKSARRADAARINDDEYVKEVTTISFGKCSERLRIEILTTLNGVKWPVSSVILHIISPDCYPILDWRALYSTGVSVPSQYDYPFWDLYCRYFRDMSSKLGVSIRTIDKALWQYSKEHSSKKLSTRTVQASAIH